MDANKIEALQRAAYRIRECCALCTGFVQGKKSPLWGTCELRTYRHGKHTEKLTGGCRRASVMACGWCPDFQKDEVLMRKHVGDYVCLMEGRDAADQPKS